MYPITLGIIRACWAVFCIVWLIGALMRKRSVYQEGRLDRLRYVIPLVLGWLFLFDSYRLGSPLNFRVIPRHDLVAVLAAILSVTGLIICVWARLTLGRNWSGTITVKEDHELITRGPYRFVRHPIYTGILTMCFAALLVIGNFSGFIGITLIFLGIWVKLRDEEAVMLQQFPAEYPAYCERVKRLIPFVL